MHRLNLPLLMIPLAFAWPAMADESTSAPASDATVSASSQPAESSEAPADTKNAQPPFFRLDYSGDFLHSPALTGDWGGARTKLAENGISLNAETLNYAQGNAHGGKSTNDAFRYGGHADYFLQLDTYRMGLWPGGYFKVSGETEWGQDITQQVGSIMPPNFATLLLESDVPGETALNEYYMMQFLSEKFGLIAGMVDLTTLPGQNEFFSNRYNQFMNTALWFNPVSFAMLPICGMTAGAIYLPTKWLTGATLVIDPNGRPTQSGFESGFHGRQGATILQTATIEIKPFDLLGHHRFNFALTTRKQFKLEDTDRLVLSGLAAPNFGRLNLPNALRIAGRDFRLRRTLLRAALSRLLEPSQENGCWGFWYDFDQYLYTCPEDKQQGVGVFGSFGWGNPTFDPVNTFYSFGLGGKGMIPERPRDRYGIGYFCMNMSDDFPGILNLQAEQGVELFYNIEITPWLHVSPDLQILAHPSGSDRHDVALVYGLRMQVSL